MKKTEVSVREEAIEYVTGVMPYSAQKSFNSPADVVRAVPESIRKADREFFCVMHLDARHKIMSLNIVSIGCMDASIVHPREVFRNAIIERSAAIIAFHNHPSGEPNPSRDDIALTSRLLKCGELLGIPLLDHLIVTAQADTYTSLRESNWDDVAFTGPEGD